jgi:uncharacterized protein
MKLTQDLDPSLNFVRGYGPGEVRIAGQVLRRPFLAAAQTLLIDWPAQDPASLTAQLLEPIWALEPQVVLLGSGAQRHFPDKAIRRAFSERGVALEPMDLGAACRTYNVLLQEDRPVVAALFP